MAVNGSEPVTAVADRPAQERARETLTGVLVRPAWLLLAALTVPFAFGATVPRWLQYVPLVASVVFVGLPHGALDHLVPARLRGVSAARSVAAVTLLYLVLGGAYVVVWLLAPVVAFALFVLLTWAHWGQGEVHALLAFLGGSHLRTRGQRVLAGAVRGALPMLVPLVAHPRQYRRVAALLVGRFADPTGALSWLFQPVVRLAVAAGLGCLVLVSLALGARRGEGSRASADWRRDALETLLLVAFFATVPPVLAVGVYFCVWHAARHVGRLVLSDPVAATALRRGDVTGPLWRFARDAAPLTVVSLVLLGGLYVLVPAPPTTLEGWVALYLVLVAVLTLPHAAVVTWMDRVQGLWTPAGDAVPCPDG